MTGIDEVLAGEGSAAERHEVPEPIPGDVTVHRPNLSRSSVVSVRVSAAELERLHTAAERAGLPLSTLMRVWALDRVESEDRGAGGDVGERLARLEREVFKRGA
ncbi:plasmid mobilization protein [Tomitella fengzijianii]|uniref:CopG family transcriptional regulator n=1 Tax=Tomitella fengzijianii TaxID=2597660 RepID=A0A516X6Z3_9ACTN|nr:CopG family transcriptional regulator [Tomitella fengzijianii]QDQ98431.1 CopG family transcriptional regulator [Tomitella fengzijianii]